MMWGASEGMGWWMLFGSVFWVVVVALVVWLFSRGFDGGGRDGAPEPRRSQEDPIDIARRRYAAGEIEEEEFRRIRDTLKS